MAVSFYQKLTDHFKSIYHLQHLQAIVGWDQATQMPAGGNEARSDALSELAITIHQAYNLPALDEWFEHAKDESLDIPQQQSLIEMRRHWQQATMLPAELVRAKSIAGSRCEHAWREQRRNNNWEEFKSLLKEVVILSREEANIRSSITGMMPYDALLDQYEPRMTQDRLDQLFLPMKQWLPDLISKVQEHQKSWQRLKPGHYDGAAQKRVGLKIMEHLGFDFNHGRLDVSAHPFCGGVAEDVRITTRYESEDFSRSLMGIVHETGHARYEQNLPQQWRSLPVGQARSMGIHESQSLFFEMQLAKKPSFLKQILPWLREELVPELNLDKLCQHYLKVEPSYIRVDADEVTYPAHILLRYQIERDLISGAIEVDDIPQMWDELMQKYLGLSTSGNYRDGCMQDIHWTDGSFGYFPSYTLGAMYAAQFMASMKKTVDVEHAIHSGNLTPIFVWLSDNIWSKGSFLTTDELIKTATEEALNPDHFKQHLMTRYLL